MIIYIVPYSLDAYSPTIRRKSMAGSIFGEITETHGLIDYDLEHQRNVQTLTEKNNVYLLTLRK
jgi:hypothetical protein